MNSEPKVGDGGIEDTSPDNVKPSDLVDLKQWRADETKRKADELAAKIAEVKQTNPDKEDFDLAKFDEIYGVEYLANVTNPERKKEILDSLQREYYFERPDTNTLEDFAKQKFEVDEHTNE